MCIDPVTAGMKNGLIYILLCILPAQGMAQEMAIVYGRVAGEDGNPVFPASISVPDYPYGTLTDTTGSFELRVPAGEDITLLISFLGYKRSQIPLRLRPGQRREISVQLEREARALGEVTVRDQGERFSTLSRIEMKSLDMLPNVSGNIETILLTLPGVTSRNELSSQYSVRGGNFDENLVYVNGIEVHRPFLIRSGRQEGLSFVNADMVSSINFSAGGFEALYGDKMSSVLDITYRRPAETGGSLNLSMLGGSLHFEGSSAGQRFTHTSGLRYKTSQYLLKSLETKGEYQPDFLDFQTFMTYRPNTDWELSFLGNIAGNRFRFIPDTRNTDFGTFRSPLNLVIYYEGQERDWFGTYTGAFTVHYISGENLSLKFTGSGFHSVEQEYYDIQGLYSINELDNQVNSETYGDSILNIGIGSMLNHARNDLSAYVYSLSHTGTFVEGRNNLKWGFNWQLEKIEDQISEWEKIDSSGYSVPYDGNSIRLYNVVKSGNLLSSNRLNAFVQNTYSHLAGSALFHVNLGVRAAYWDMNGQFLLSPRLNLSMRPGWDRDIVLRLAAGYYFQPPFYREMRYPDGSLNTKVRAQESMHFIVGGDYIFAAWDRPFKFTTELYYKHLDKLIPYKTDNVRLEYAAENMAAGYAVGLDMKIHGEFVPGAESWASLSLMKAEEDIKGDFYYDENGHRMDPGFYPRPTDQRLTVGVFFQDYFPNNPDYKVHLNLVYGSGLPFSSPDPDRYDLVFRMPAYKRVDIGFSKILKREDSQLKDNNPFRFFRDSWISAEIFNLLGVRNTISYLWVKTVSNQDDVQGRFAVPNYLTGRRFNIRLSIKF